MVKNPPPSKITPEMLGYGTGNLMSSGLNGMFEGELGETNPNEYLKELFDTATNIEGKTDLTAKQINAITKIRFLALVLGEPNKDGSTTPDPSINGIIEDFMRLRVSKDRLSRKEFIQGINGENGNNSRNSVFDRIGNWFRGG